jgi:membrane associated rhomboid family serine protease
MFPIRAENPTSSTTYVSLGLIILNSLIFLFVGPRPGDGGRRLIYQYGFLPAELVRSPDQFAEGLRKNPPLRQVRDRRGRPLVDFFGRPLVRPDRRALQAATALPAWINIFTCLFLHGSWWHLLGNMLYLWIFGSNIEDRLGPLLFIVFYLGTGVVGNLTHTFFDPGFVPLIGASGAVSGIMGAYILLFPRTRILAIVPIGFYPSTWSLPAWVFLGFYFLMQNLFPAAFGAAAGNVAYWAHIGGFLSGLALIHAFPLRPPPPAPPPRHHHEEDDADFVF